MKYRKQLSANIRAEMARHDQNQADIARLLGVTQPQVSKRLHGHQEWRFGELLKLAATWDIDLSTLTQGTEDRPFDENGPVKEVAAA